MPTNRRRITRTRSAPTIERSRWAEFALEFWELDGLLSPFNGDVDAALAYWERFGDEITAEWIAGNEWQKPAPGTRPRPWWIWTHGESRPIVNPGPREMEELWWGFVAEGVLHTHILHGYGRKPGDDLLPWQELEADYLDRMGLLTDEERQALAPEAPGGPRSDPGHSARPIRRPGNPRRY